MSQIKNSILDTIGNTPIVRINNLAPDDVEIFVKLEGFQPDGVGQGPAGAWRDRNRRT